GVEEMIQGKTVFLVSHMLSYIRNADQILVLSDGVLKGCGKHEELMRTVPLYKTMWEKEKSVKNWKLQEKFQ
ncbi:MAG: ABC transporter ATP-binding protein, partial [Hespellia sp.]|nr:ABC transporter ATP-binding protein [Hespellia sp.]